MQSFLLIRQGYPALLRQVQENLDCWRAIARCTAIGGKPIWCVWGRGRDAWSQIIPAALIENGAFRLIMVAILLTLHILLDRLTLGGASAGWASWITKALTRSAYTRCTLSTGGAGIIRSRGLKLAHSNNVWVWNGSCRHWASAILCEALIRVAARTACSLVGVDVTTTAIRVLRLRHWLRENIPIGEAGRRLERSGRVRE